MNPSHPSLYHLAYYHSAGSGFGGHLADVAGRAVIYSTVGRLLRSLHGPELVAVVAAGIFCMWWFNRGRRW